MIIMTTYYWSMPTIIEDNTLEITMMMNGYELYRYWVVSDTVQSSLLNFVESREIGNQNNIFFNIRLLLFSGTPTTIQIVLLLSFVLAVAEVVVVLYAFFVVVVVEIVDDVDVVVVVVSYAGTIISSGICSDGIVLILRVTS